MEKNIQINLLSYRSKAIVTAIIILFMNLTILFSPLAHIDEQNYYPLNAWNLFTFRSASQISFEILVHSIDHNIYDPPINKDELINNHLAISFDYVSQLVRKFFWSHINGYKNSKERYSSLINSIFSKYCYVNYNIHIKLVPNNQVLMPFDEMTFEKEFHSGQQTFSKQCL